MIKKVDVWILLLGCLIFIPLQGYGQSAIGGAFQMGKILPINKTFPSILSNSWSLSLDYTFYTQGKKNKWVRHLNFPTTNIQFSVEHFGNKEVMGRAYGILPSLGFFMLRKKRSNLQLQTGVGLAYLDRPFNKITNPSNQIIGSHVNFFAALRLINEWNISDHLKLFAVLGIHHYSNSAFANPNIGNNTPQGGLGIKWCFEAIDYPKDKERFVPAPLDSLSSKVHFFLRSSFGITEKGYDGPKYIAYAFSPGVYRHFGQLHKLSVGGEYLFNHAPYQFMQHIGFESESNFLQASRFSLFLGYELHLGHLGFITEIGYYLNKHYEQRSRISTKFGFHLYARNPIKFNRHLPYVGVYIRSYLGEAEFLEMVAGYAF